jgi:ribonucleoside-triphosphate reductase
MGGVETEQGMSEGPTGWQAERAAHEAWVEGVLADLSDADPFKGLSVGQRAASEAVRLRTYSKLIGGRRETWRETVTRAVAYLRYRSRWRVEDDVLKRYDSELADAARAIFRREVMPSMRLLWAAGDVLERNDVGLYNCLGIETQFITDQGVKRFSDFAHGEAVNVLTHSGEYKPAVVRCYGKQQLYRVNLVRGRSSKIVRATKDHQWILRSGERTWSLNTGDRLLPPPRVVGDWDYYSATPEERWFWAMGFVFGDGTVIKNKDGDPVYSAVRLCGAKGQYLNRFQELGFSWSQPKSAGGDAMAYTGRYTKDTPSIEEDGIANVTAFVRGYLDADGAKNPNGDDVSPFCSIQASGSKSIEFIRSVFPAVGCYITREEVLTGRETNFGTRPETIRFGLSQGFGTGTGGTYSVKSIEEDAVEPVWCLEVEDDHSFVMPAGIVTGNCAFAPADSPAIFWESLYVLMHGTGFGFSVESQFVDNLPIPLPPSGQAPALTIVGDSTEGWRNAVEFGVTRWFAGLDARFDTSKVRPAGSKLATKGGEASGPEPLLEYLDALRTAIQAAGREGRRLRPIEVHDLLCHSGGIVQVGGVRRSAEISFSDRADKEMALAKHGPTWGEQGFPLVRYQANNSWILTPDCSRADFDVQWEILRTGCSGERGIVAPARAAYRGHDVRGNPCMEIWLAFERASGAWNGSGGGQFCNLTNVVLRPWDDWQSAARKAELAAFIGTIQASMTNFKGLRKGWTRVTERDALLGVGLAGQVDCQRVSTDAGAMGAMNRRAVRANELWADAFSINRAAGVTCGKPDGNGSVFLGCAAGIHAWHGEYFVRHVQISAKSPICKLLRASGVPCLITLDKEHERFEAGEIGEGQVSSWSFRFPAKAPDGALVRAAESALDLLGRLERVNGSWLAEKGHNQSVSVTVAPDEWPAVADWVWEHRDNLGGVSFFPLDTSGTVYRFLPYEDVSAEEFAQLEAEFPVIDWGRLAEFENGVSEAAQTFACVSGACAIV